MKIDNLYEHADEGYYCKLAEGLLKDPATGDWGPSVVYTGSREPSNVMLTTTEERWKERFNPVAEYTGDDEDVLAMIRRCNPDPDFKMEDVWASWHEAESAINSEVIELAVCAIIASFAFNDSSGMSFVLTRDNVGHPAVARITLKAAHLRNILLNYEIKREPCEDGYIFSLRKAG